MDGAYLHGLFYVRHIDLFSYFCFVEAGTGSETPEQGKSAAVKPCLNLQHPQLLGLSPNVSVDMMRRDSNTLEWDHFGENMVSETVGDQSFGMDEGFPKSPKNIEVKYHPDLLAMLNQIEKEDCLKMIKAIHTKDTNDEKLSESGTY